MGRKISKDRYSMNNIKFSILNQIGKQITGDLKFCNDKKKKPVIFFLHGFKGFKDWGFFPYVTEKFALRGAITICYNFSLNGMIEGSDLIVNTEDFANNTVTHELNDSLLIIEKFRNGEILPLNVLKENWNGKILLVGHSLGGAIAILTAKSNNEVDKISLWASISTFGRYTQRQQKIWREKGYNEFTVTRTGQVVRMNVEYMDDVLRNMEKYDLISSMKQLQASVQIVHGKQDLTVRIREGEALYNAGIKERTFFEVIPATGHTFGVEHPFKETNKALETVMEKTIKFFGLA